MTNTLILDVDGVLNAFPPGHKRGRYLEKGFHSIQVQGHAHEGLFPIMFHPDIVAAVNGLADDGVRVLWLTSWGELARTNLAPAIGLHDFRVLDSQREEDERSAFSPNWWKLLAVKQLLQDAQPGDRIVWVDDDIPKPVKKAIEVESQGSLKAFRPNSSTGLRMPDLSRLVGFFS